MNTPAYSLLSAYFHSSSLRSAKYGTKRFLGGTGLLLFVLIPCWSAFAQSRVPPPTKSLPTLSLRARALPGTAGGNASRPAPSKAGGKSKLRYADLPLRFERAQGAAARRTSFVVAGRGYRLSLLPQEARFDFIPPDDDSRQAHPGQFDHFSPAAGISATPAAMGHTVEGSTQLEDDFEIALQSATQKWEA